MVVKMRRIKCGVRFTNGRSARLCRAGTLCFARALFHGFAVRARCALFFKHRFIAPASKASIAPASKASIAPASKASIAPASVSEQSPPSRAEGTFTESNKTG